MKKLLIMCGAGHATSTIAVSKVTKWLNDEKLTESVKIYQSKIADELNKIDTYDVVISTTIVPESIKGKVINGLALLTGVGLNEFFAELKKRLAI
ncbi:PTS system, galactitol-specific IIB component [Gilliamella bombicola]|uniref:PTS system, galactitol-specific IIB component n=1 Tax=Gilliamella bombicola TaxID=1798182 RepID=A0A1C4A8X5_9GAMM|nr:MULTISPECIES: PTS sugar transporter subunit IIB [Gilliamella]MWN06539.1 PTS galactitol transporter subunit IIB [Gilliamella sp. Pas-s95]NUF27164.1 PTS sugar transporter subunit IIB [Gilliamella sp. ESL0254]SCB91056.1 PTS system, galactitol-specific IIB component [Gilliamella bombicola]